MTEITPIVFVVDAANLLQASVAITSIVENVSDGPPLHIEIHHSGPPQQRFDQRRWGAHTVQLRAFANPFGDYEAKDHVSPASLMRLEIPERLLRHDKAVYLDADLIVTGDIRDLLDFDLGKAAIAGVADLGIQALLSPAPEVSGEDLPGYFRTVLNLDPASAQYINSGVLVMDLAELRRLEFTRCATQMVRENRGRLRWGDQDAINCVLQGRIAELDPRWNAMEFKIYRNVWRPLLAPYLRAQAELQERSPLIVHYTGPFKPWRDLHCSPRAGLWWSYAIRTDPRQRFAFWQLQLQDAYRNRRQALSRFLADHPVLKRCLMPTVRMLRWVRSWLRSRG